jgi:hypothetical protein
MCLHAGKGVCVYIPGYVCVYAELSGPPLSAVYEADFAQIEGAAPPSPSPCVAEA